MTEANGALGGFAQLLSLISGQYHPQTEYKMIQKITEITLYYVASGLSNIHQECDSTISGSSL